MILFLKNSWKNSVEPGKENIKDDLLHIEEKTDLFCINTELYRIVYKYTNIIGVTKKYTI